MCQQVELSASMNTWQATCRPSPFIHETNGKQYVLFHTQNRKFQPYLATINIVLTSVMIA
jgi:hypothetical protein